MANIFTKLLQSNTITTITDGDKVIIACDCVTNEEHSMVAEATQYEIEDGSNLNDHIINHGKTIKIEGIVSDDPLTYLQTNILDRTISSITPEILRSKLNFSLSGENGKPSKEAFDQLEKIYDEKRPINIITGLKRYENCAMESLIIPRDQNTVRALKFTAIFRQMNIISTKKVLAPTTLKMEEGLGAEELENKGTKSGANLENDNKTFTLKAFDTIYNAGTKIFGL